MNNGQELVATTPFPGMGRSHPVDNELAINDLWRLLLRRRGIVFATTIFFVAAVGLYCAFSTRRYQASAELEVQKETASPLGLGGVENGTDSDALQTNMTLQTQVGILKSDSLALSVIQKLNLEENPDFRPKFSPIGWMVGLLSPGGPQDPSWATLEDSPRRRTLTLGVFQSSLEVKPVPGTRLIDVSFLNSDPAVAADVANSVAQGLVEFNFQIRHTATSRTADWLSGQLGDLRRQSEEAQVRLAQAQRNSGVLSLGGVDSQGREQLYSTALDKLQQSTSAYTQAQSSRILKQALNEVAKTEDPEAISNLNDSSIFSGTNGVTNSLTLLQTLRAQQAELQTQTAELAAKFGPAYPKLGEMQSKLDANQNAIHAEVKRIANRARNDYTVARQVENDAYRIYAEQKQEAGQLNDKAMAYSILRQEADQSRTLYESLFRQLKQAGVMADFHSNNIALVDQARVPAKPARPRVLIFMLASVCGGLFFGFCGALVRDGMDSKIQGLSHLETALDQPVFGLLPYHKAPGKQIFAGLPVQTLSSNRRSLTGAAINMELEFQQPVPASLSAEFPALGNRQSPYVESLRAIRTSLLLSRGGAPPKTILVTSPSVGEGKSMLCLNLATLMAQQGKKVLLVDADMRRPTLHQRLGVSSRDGLSSFLTGNGVHRDAVSVIVPCDKVPGLHFLPAGPLPPYPSELLGSLQMRNGLRVWRKPFDFIILDGPPVLAVTDSVILSAMVDFTLLLARHKVTERASLERARRVLQAQSTANQIGVVLNAVHDSETVYHEYYAHSS